MAEQANGTIREKKDALRKRVKADVHACDDAYIRESDAGIYENLAAEEGLQNAKTVFCYVSVGREPDTRKIIEKLLAEGKTVCAPRCLGNGVMEARAFSSLGELEEAMLGIPAPKADAPLVRPEDIDFVVAPCVAASPACHRLGHGGGYYDRFLSQVRCPVVCLSRGKTMHDFIPVEKCDIMVDKVLTESRVHQRGGE